MRCGIAPLTICFLNLSKVDAKLHSLSIPPCIFANRHATEDRYKRAKYGLCKGDCLVGVLPVRSIYTAQGKELMLTVKMKTRHPVWGSI